MAQEYKLILKYADEPGYTPDMECYLRHGGYEILKKALAIPAKDSPDGKKITAQEQKLGAKSSYDTLVTQNNLAIAESTLVGAKTAFEKAKVDIERATGKTLQRMGVSIEDAKTGVVTREP